MTTAAAHSETSMPIWDSLTARPALICGSSAAGSISAVTSVKVAAPRMTSASQGNEGESASGFENPV